MSKHSSLILCLPVSYFLSHILIQSSPCLLGSHLAPSPDWNPFLKCVITIEQDKSINWRLPHFHSFHSLLSDECLLGRPHHSAVFHGDVSFSLFPGGLPLWRTPRGGCGAAVPPRSSRGRHHTQWAEARGEQQQRRAVQMWSCGGVCQSVQSKISHQLKAWFPVILLWIFMVPRQLIVIFCIMPFSFPLASPSGQNVHLFTDECQNVAGLAPHPCSAERQEHSPFWTFLLSGCFQAKMSNLHTI